MPPASTGTTHCSAVRCGVWSWSLSCPQAGLCLGRVVLYSGAVLSDENRILYLRWVVQCMKDLVSGWVWADV